MVGPFDPVPRLYGNLVLVCLGALAAGLVAAAFVRIDVVVRASAVVRPVTEGSTVRNAAAGAVAEVSYVQGQRVAKGALLWRIEQEAVSADRRTTLGQRNRLEGEASQWRAYAESLAREENLVPSHFPEAYHRAESYFAEVHRLESLASDLEGQWNREVRLPAELRSPQKVDDLEAAWRRAVLDVQRFQSGEREKLEVERRALLRAQEALEQHLADLDKSLASAVVRAPVGGIVEDLRPCHVHDYLAEGEPVVRIVPLDDHVLRLDLRVDPRDVAEVTVGQKVLSRFAGLPPSRFGPVASTITRISADSIVVEGTLTAFTVEALLSEVTFQDRAGHRLSLKPGMAADSRIVVAQRPALSLLLEALEFLP